MNLKEKLESQDFYELMQIYRHSVWLYVPWNAFNNVKDFILNNNENMTKEYLNILIQARDIAKEQIDKLDDKQNIKLKIAFARLDWIIQSAELYFAITEVKRILNWEKQYTFPNGTIVILQ